MGTRKLLNPMTVRLIGLGLAATAGATFGQILDATTHVSLGAALTVGVSVVTAGWWLGQKFQAIEDRDKAVATALKASDEKTTAALDALDKKLNRLPCQVVAPPAVCQGPAFASEATAGKPKP